MIIYVEGLESLGFVCLVPVTSHRAPASLSHAHTHSTFGMKFAAALASTVCWGSWEGLLLLAAALASTMCCGSLEALLQAAARP